MQAANAPSPSCQIPGAGQLIAEATTQPPRRGSQQVPDGCGHGLGSQVIHSACPRCQAPGDGHNTSCATVQVPSGWQHTPIGAAAGQANVSHVNVSCHRCVGATQAASVVIAQVPSRTLQQAKTGCGHGLFGVQVSQSSCQIFGEAQSACVVTVHVPAEAQQAPVGGSGHGFGVQASQSSCHIAGDVQPGCVVTEQVPANTQQAPVAGCGHGFGGQVHPA